MISVTWLKKRREHWIELEALLERVEKHGLRSLDQHELQKIVLLYRQAAADLSALRQDPSGSSYGRHLSGVLSRAHNSIYGGTRSETSALPRFFLYTFPDVFRRNLNFTVAAFALFLLAAVVGTLLTLYDPDFPLEVLGPHMVNTIERHEMWTHSVVAMAPLASSSIMTNNISVSIMMFSTGILAGTGTVLLTFFNGLLIGVIGTACWNNEMSLQLWSFVAPHGVLELPSIVIAAGAGLRLAFGLLFPGYLPRRQSLVIAGTEAVQMLLGVLPILVMAGVIEGFISPSALPVPLKFAFAAAIAVLLLFYLFVPIKAKIALKAAAAK